MAQRIEVRSQAEFDACVKAGNVAIVIDCRVVARENSSVVAWGNSSVVARENSSVVAWGNSSVVAWGNSSVEARENSSVEAWGNSSVVARENSSVVARENSSVVAWGNSSVEAFGSVFIRLFRALKIKASAHVAIMMHGDAQEIDGGQRVTPAPEPTTASLGAQWCDHYGINRESAPFVVPQLDAKIYESIKAGGVLDMSKWHTCETTHCRAGWAIVHAGEAGKLLEKKLGSEIAGRMIYAASRPDKPLPNFYAENEKALEEIAADAGIAA